MFLSMLCFPVSVVCVVCVVCVKGVCVCCVHLNAFIAALTSHGPSVWEVACWRDGGGQ